jgi:hypothetical protein
MAIKTEEKKLIENSIRLKAFKTDDHIFVSLSTAIKPFAFVCKKNELRETVENVLELLPPIVKSYSIKKQKMPCSQDSYFTKLFVDDSNLVQAEFNCGKKMTAKLKDFGYTTVAPSAKDIVNLISKNIK